MIAKHPSSAERAARTETNNSRGKAFPTRVSPNQLCVPTTSTVLLQDSTFAGVRKVLHKPLP